MTSESESDIIHTAGLDNSNTKSSHTGLYIIIAALVVVMISLGIFLISENGRNSLGNFFGGSVTDTTSIAKDSILTSQEIEVRQQKELLAAQREQERIETEKLAKEENERYLEHEREMAKYKEDNRQYEGSNGSRSGNQSGSKPDFDLQIRYMQLDKACHDLLGKIVALNRKGKCNVIIYGQIKFQIYDNLEEMKRIGKKIGTYDDAVKIEQEYHDAFYRFEERGYR